MASSARPSGVKRASSVTESAGNTSMAQNDEIIAVGEKTAEELEEGRPWFIREQFIKDINGNKPDNLKYDSSTLMIPKDEWK